MLRALPAGSARLVLQIDMGAGDSVWPAPQSCNYPTLLEFPAPRVLAYPREAVIAEKLEAMVVLGDRNSRIKDFFDLHFLASQFEVDRATLTEAIRRTFERRRTPIPSEPPNRTHSSVLGEHFSTRSGECIRATRGAHYPHGSWAGSRGSAGGIPAPRTRRLGV